MRFSYNTVLSFITLDREIIFPVKRGKYCMMRFQKFFYINVREKKSITEKKVPSQKQINDNFKMIFPKINLSTDFI